MGASSPCIRLTSVCLHEEKWRPLVGIARKRSGALYRDPLQGTSVSCPRRLCWQSDIVSLLPVSRCGPLTADPVP